MNDKSGIIHQLDQQGTAIEKGEIILNIQLDSLTRPDTGLPKHASF